VSHTEIQPNLSSQEKEAECDDLKEELEEFQVSLRICAKKTLSNHSLSFLLIQSSSKEIEDMITADLEKAEKELAVAKKDKQRALEEKQKIQVCKLNNIIEIYNSLVAIHTFLVSLMLHSIQEKSQQRIKELSDELEKSQVHLASTKHLRVRLQSTLTSCVLVTGRI